MLQSGVARTGSPAVASLFFFLRCIQHQSVHDVFVRLETRVGHIYNRRDENGEQEGREHDAVANPVILRGLLGREMIRGTSVYKSPTRVNIKQVKNDKK